MSNLSGVSSIGEPEFLKLVDVSKTFGSHRVLDKINLTVSEGEVLVIIGPSGSGKSTLLRCINFIAAPDEGEVIFEGHVWKSRISKYNFLANRRYEQKLTALRSEIGMVFQNFNVFPHMTAAQNVMLGLTKVRKQNKDLARKAAVEALTQVGLADKVDQYPDKLSGGQKQRVAIARALALKPKVMLFDEATSSLDPELVNGILEEIRRLAKAGMTMVVVTHEMNFAFQVAHRIVFMDEGRIVEIGTPEEIRKTTEPRTRSFLSAILN
ncbi:MAG: amino acid ABC transporter ATP-binding protein [Actinobacteria bacterium]|nr:amino acid ABC transporter ATP-binding protein [Actinomycetota bacterium]